MTARATKPKCETCGKHSDVQTAPRPGTIPGSFPALRWVCASCLYLEEHPDARLFDPSPYGRGRR